VPGGFDAGAWSVALAGLYSRIRRSVLPVRSCTIDEKKVSLMAGEK
jgi:hypothetical protein